MELVMKDIFLVIGGCLGMVVAVLHGYLGETRIVGPIQNSPACAKRVIQAIMFLSAVYWFVGGAVLALTPFFQGAGDRRLSALIVGALYISGAAANIWATRGRHFGWGLLTITTVFIWLGA